jgi:hypothetical protein
MEIQSIEARLNLFLDGLDVEGLLCLRRILNCDRESPSNNYFAGRIDTLLRVVHHVDEAVLKNTTATKKERA